MARTTTQYRLQGSGFSLPESDYSKYNERWEMSRAGEISPNEIYGKEQALEHYREYTSRLDRYAKSRQREQITLQAVVTTVVDIEVLKPEPLEIHTEVTNQLLYNHLGEMALASVILPGNKYPNEVIGRLEHQDNDIYLNGSVYGNIHAHQISEIIFQK